MFLEGGGGGGGGGVSKNKGIHDFFNHRSYKHKKHHFFQTQLPWVYGV